MNFPQLISDDALKLLDRRVFDPLARGRYDYFSGGLFWEDEFPPLTDEEDSQVIWNGDLPRYVIACRASLTLGEANQGYLTLWQQVSERAPNWPGLRPERRGPEARKRLRAARRVEGRCLAELERDPDQ